MLGSGHLQQRKQKSLPDGLGVGSERRRRVKEDCQVVGLNLCKNAGVIHWDGEGLGVGS